MTDPELIPIWRKRTLQAYALLAETFVSAKNGRGLQNRITCWSLPGATLVFVFPDKTSLIVDPSAYDPQLKPAFSDMLREMDPVDFALISHLHKDHYDPAVLGLLAGKLGCNLLIPVAIYEQVESETDIGGDVTRVELHKPTPLSSEVSLLTFEAPHISIEHSFGFVLEAVGKTIVIANDIRDYESAQIPPQGLNADIMFFSVWLGTEQANNPDPRLVREAAEFIRRSLPQKVFFYHLYNTGRDICDIWQDRHCTLIKDALGWPADSVGRPDFGNPIYV